MAKSAYNKVITLLPALSKEEMQKVASLISLSLKGQGEVQQAIATEDNINRMDELFYRTCADYVHRMNGTRYPTLAVMKRKQKELFMQILYAREEVDKFEAEWVGGKDSRARKRFYGAFCRVVGRYIIDRTPAPLSIKTIVQRVDDFPSIMDSQFPGYIASNTVNLVVSLIGTRVE